jgi:hypothetical protein
LLEQAREESEHILARAQEQATYLIEERELTRQAEELSHEIVRQAQVEADQVRRGADDYAAEVLVNLEREVMRVLKQIKGGLDLLDDRRAEAEQASSAAGVAAMAADAYQQSQIAGDGAEDEYELEEDSGETGYAGDRYAEAEAGDGDGDGGEATEDDEDDNPDGYGPDEYDDDAERTVGH